MGWAAGRKGGGRGEQVHQLLFEKRAPLWWTGHSLRLDRPFPALRTPRRAWTVFREAAPASLEPSFAVLITLLHWSLIGQRRGTEK